MKEFNAAATQIKNDFITEWQQSGKKIVGHTCSYVPKEIFHAANILPVRLRGIQTKGMDIADAYYGPFICSFPKCILQLAGQKAYSFLDGVVITPGCDAMRRLDDCWRSAGKDITDITPDYFYYFDVPHKTEVHGTKWFMAEIRRLIESIEAHFKVSITHEKLSAAIRLFNQGRRYLSAVEALRSSSTLKVTGTEVFAATIAGAVIPIDDFNRLMEKWVAKISCRTRAIQGAKRLMLAGSISDEIDLVNLVETSADAVVVADNLCFGSRSQGEEISENGDPVQALAAHYLGRSACPRMFGKYKERLARIKKIIKRARVDAVILQNIRFCDLHGAENSLLQRDLEALGVACLKVEREYGPLTETGRMKLRLNAFLERL